MSKGLGQKIAIKFNKSLTGDINGNDFAFTITGQERKYVGGELIDGDYQVEKVERYSQAEELEDPQDTILLTMDPSKRFNNVEGNLTISYDKLLGNLKGIAGLVESFTNEFTPIDLVQKLNPHETDRFITTPNINIDFSLITYRYRYIDERFIATPSCTIDFINVDEIYP